MCLRRHLLPRLFLQKPSVRYRPWDVSILAKGVDPKPTAPSKEARIPDINIRPDLPQTELYLVRRIDGVIKAIEPITVQDVSFMASAQPGTRGPQFSVNMTFPLYASQASSISARPFGQTPARFFFARWCFGRSLSPTHSCFWGFHSFFQ